MLKYKFLIFTIFAAALLSGCSSVNVTSIWTDSLVTIDGVDDEWQNNTYYIKDQNLLLGVKNDAEYFYFALMTNDESNKAKIMRGGLTLWFDNEGEGEKKFGIRFPAGMKMPEMPKEQGEFTPGTEGMQKPDFSAIESQFTELEILGPDGKDAARMNADAAKGIAVKMKMTDEKLIYEFKMAIKKKDPSYYAIDVNEDKVFSLGIETAEMNMKNMKGRTGGGEMPDGDMPPGGGPGGGMPGGGPGGPGRSSPGPMGGGRPGASASQEPLSYWLDVTLSDKQ
jgi:hypothetical protein